VKKTRVFQSNAGTDFVDGEHHLVEEREFTFKRTFGSGFYRYDGGALFGEFLHGHIKGISLDHALYTGAFGVLYDVGEIWHIALPSYIYLIQQ
jgi:hypothetical protein